ncbi:ABC transporter permease [Variovorax sp. NFACC27]|uniref:MlaE family ABC transporter permease n=1 Tax=unclassified Variovorax TaxID=663243 RepID=UPI00089711C2|nr:phospholipid/cholesterol/gamma-HCH transport system permease protein [Variovorax sp. NFACC28]SEG45968.1 phospholipid/cholesterol/gamma-HCH transport system permease protein [Variovorax sp. NFACC29]SFC27052.1 phospholipid/cholesterol/gamma-HCH transport system permease protein [Variovorax sp. NFACC26]SFG62164.1 phospholipid/cholesterol/gamma-HCH transport system permease protein [Variovorax sp. NFACC27]
MSPATSPADASAADSAWPRIGQREQDGRQWTVASGCWTTLAMSSKPAWMALAKSLEAAPPADDRAWDLRPIGQLDHIGAQLLWEHWRHQWPATLEMLPQHKAVLDQVAQYTVATPDEPSPSLNERIRAFSHNGPRAMYVMRDFTMLVGQLALDLGRLVRAPHRGPWRDFSGHLYQFGATALHITALVGLLIGVVLAYLISQQLRQYGAETFVVNILGLSLIRELGPVLAAVLIAGRSGSAITAQIGVMRVTEELDAMRVMGIPHGFRLVMPRVLALAIAMPLISLWTSMAALAGGMLAADAALDISPAYFLSALPRAVPISNLWLAMAKSAVFGILIALIGCYFGMKVKPNTESLGRGTTSSVVTSITAVILVDALFAVLFKGIGFRA